MLMEQTLQTLNALRLPGMATAFAETVAITNRHAVFCAIRNYCRKVAVGVKAGIG